MQYIKYIENNFPEHYYEIFDISEKIKAIEKNSEMYDKIINSVSQSDIVIWAFPVYYYKGKDAFTDFFEDKIKKSDIIIFAGEIKDRYLSSNFKLYFDRSFYNNHNPALTKKQVGFLISGPLSQIPNLKQILDAYIDFQQANLAGYITDEFIDSSGLDSLILNFAKTIIGFSETNFIKPRTFPGVGGMKIFRDDIWGRLRFPFKSDYNNYKKNGFFDFPQKDIKRNFQNAILLLLTKISPAVRKEIYEKRMKKEMIKPFQKITVNN